MYTSEQHKGALKDERVMSIISIPSQQTERVFLNGVGRGEETVEKSTLVS